ncbi:polymer-forming cytoskeletal protein [bacterium]|nr:polymer-forming cytoskeletal protein [bacterium]MCP5463286.1 polymer-forming cytoskeletal protein [bacterium]
MSNILKRLSNASHEKTTPAPLPNATLKDVMKSTITQPKEQRNGSTSLLTRDVTFEGDIECSSPITIFGNIKGSIVTSSSVTLEQGADISANINTKTLVARGKFNGTISAEENVHLLSSAEISGTIKAKTLKVEDGVYFVGKAQISR